MATSILPERSIRALQEASASALHQAISTHTAVLRSVPDQQFAPFHLANEICRAIAPVLATQLTAIRGNDPAALRPQLTTAPPSQRPSQSSTPPFAIPLNAAQPQVTGSPPTPYADAVRRNKKPSRVPPCSTRHFGSTAGAPPPLCLNSPT